MNSVPIIDIEALIKSDSTIKQKNKVIAQIAEACREVGFFYIINHAISLDLIDRLIKFFFFLLT